MASGPCSQGSREYRCFVAAIFDNYYRNSSWSLYFLCALFLVNSQWVCQKKKIFLWKRFTGNYIKKRIPMMVLWQCKELCVNFKISQHYTCRRHFRHGKRFFKWLWELCGLSLIRNPCGTKLFHSQHLPSFIFVSVCFAFHVFLSILLYFPFECLPITTVYKKEFSSDYCFPNVSC